MVLPCGKRYANDLKQRGKRITNVVMAERGIGSEPRPVFSAALTSGDGPEITRFKREKRFGMFGMENLKSQYDCH